MNRRLLVAVAASAAAMLVMTQAHAATRESSKNYTQVAGDQYMYDCDASDPDLGGLGGVCFQLEGDEASVSVAIEDVTGLAVGGYWQFTAANESDPTDPLGGEDLGHGSFCGSVATLAVPADASFLNVFIDGPVFGPQDCLESAGTPGVGVRGTVTVVATLQEIAA